jgi:serine/threonine-protein kinase
VCGAPLTARTASPAEQNSRTLSLGQIPPLVETIQTPTLPSSALPREALSPELPTLPGYEILGVLGRGGMGVVYKARQINLNRLVALKMVSAGAHASPQQLARFHLEAEAVASLQHPNIVQIYEVSEHNRCPYFSLEFMDGGSLEDRLGGKPQPPRSAAQLVETLARAMNCAHQRGVVHRDLKPANILLQDSLIAEDAEERRGTAEASLPLRSSASSAVKDFTPKISDFGLAKRLEDPTQTQSGAILGTPSYMAPEQAAGHVREIGPATDVYALGAVLYELLTGRPPFLAKTTLETLQEVQSREPLPLARWHVKVPRDLEIICLKCLEKEPRKRYTSAEALADDLHRFLAAEPIRARPVGPWERAAKWAKRRPALAILLLISGLSVLSLLAVSLTYNALLQSALHSAEANSQRARRAVDKMLTVVAEEHLADKPHMEDKQKELLEEALAIYQECLNEKHDDPARQEETALAHKRMGEILHTLGKNDSAKDAYGQANVLLTRLVQKAPANPKYRQSLANSYNFLGEALRTSGHRADANEAYLQALRLQKELVVQFPGDLTYQQELSRTIYNCGILWAETSPEAAEGFYRQAILTLERLVHQLPEVPACQQGLARSYLNLGAVLGNTRRLQEAKAANDKAILLLENLVKNFPTNRDYKLELAVCCNNLGYSLTGTRQYVEAEKALRKAVHTLEGLTRDFPHMPKCRSELATAYNSLGLLLADTFRWPAARAAWSAARNLYEQLVAEYPDTPDYKAELGRVRGNLGWLSYHPLSYESALLGFFASSEPQASVGNILSRLGWLEFERAELGRACLDLHEGIRLVEQLFKLDPDNSGYRNTLRIQYWNLADALSRLALYADAAHAAEDYYLAAGYRARLVPLAEKDPQIPERERKAKAKKYAAAALAALKQALRSGFKDFDRLRKDPAFEALREQDDFAKLLAAQTGAKG